MAWFQWFSRSEREQSMLSSQLRPEHQGPANDPRWYTVPQHTGLRRCSLYLRHPQIGTVSNLATLRRYSFIVIQDCCYRVDGCDEHDSDGFDSWWVVLRIRFKGTRRQRFPWITIIPVESFHYCYHNITTIPIWSCQPNDKPLICYCSHDISRILTGWCFASCNRNSVWPLASVCSWEMSHSGRTPLSTADFRALFYYIEPVVKCYLCFLRKLTWLQRKHNVDWDIRPASHQTITTL